MGRALESVCIRAAAAAWQEQQQQAGWQGSCLPAAAAPVGAASIEVWQQDSVHMFT